MQQVTMGKSIDNSEWITDGEIKDIPFEDLPDLCGFHILVRPVSVKKQTKGGIFLPDSTVDDIAYLTTVGKVLKLGELAFEDRTKFPNGKWCSVGDYVCYGKHTGQKMVYMGHKLLLIYDDQVIMRIKNPSLIDPTYNLSA